MWLPSYQYVPLFALVASLVGPPPVGETTVKLKPGARIVAIGDSITHDGGYLHDIDLVLARQLPKLAIGGVRNAGVSGNKSVDMAARFDADVMEKKPDIVIIAAGINDVLLPIEKGELEDPKSLETYRRSVSAMIDKARGIGAQVVLMAPTVIDEDVEKEGNQRLTRYVEAGRAIAAEQGCAFVDTHEMFLSAIKHKPAEWKDGLFVTRDGIHMTPLGNAIMAMGVLRAMGVGERQILDTEILSKPTWRGEIEAAIAGFCSALALVMLVRLVHRRVSRSRGVSASAPGVFR